MIAEQAVKACREEFPASGFPGGFPEEACAALVMTTAKWESGLWVSVHTGETRGPAGEFCLIQAHRTIIQVPVKRFRVTKEELAASMGLDATATLTCLRIAVRTHGYHASRCGLKWTGDEDFAFRAQTLFAQYHRPDAKCLPLAPQAYSRGQAARSMLRKVRKLMAEPKTAARFSPPPDSPSLLGWQVGQELPSLPLGPPGARNQSRVYS